jgi:acyl phosphate:glycerol-3-phosphate acyltransferase
VPRPEILLLTLIPVAYLLGAIPFGLLVGFAKGIDVRTAGSGNIGATNVARLLGKRYFFLVFFLDFMKSFAPMVVASVIVSRISEAQRDWRVYALWLAVGFAAVIGHMFSVFLRFRGGKGVATSAGVMLGLIPYYTYPGLAGVVVFFLAFALTRYISVGSMAGAASFPILYYVIGRMKDWPVTGEQLPLLLLAILMALLILYKHRGNIARLRAGTENRVGSKSEPQDDA